MNCEEASYGHQVGGVAMIFTPLVARLGAMGIGRLKILLARGPAGHHSSR